MRQVGSTPLYLDVMNATLHLGGSQLAAYRDLDTDAVLTLECIPDFYGAEVTFDTITATGETNTVLTSSSVQAVVAGNHPGRVRIIVTDTSARDQHGLLWGVRSRRYSSNSNAALFYEAESLTPLDAATVVTHTGASNGHTMKHATLPGNAWCPVLSTDISILGPLIHQGSYRVWARCYSATTTPSMRLLWSVGDLSAPTTNDAVQLPGGANWYLMNLGQIRLDPSPVGVHRWTGVIQAYAGTQGDPLEIDCLYLQPLDESSGSVVAVQRDSSLGISVFAYGGLAIDNAAVGTRSWSPATIGNFNNNVVTSQSTSVTTTHYLEATQFGFAIPTGATVSGIKLEIGRASTGTGLSIADSVVKLVKAGSVVGSNRAATTTLWPTAGFRLKAYGGQTDLWGTTWTPAQINDGTFGCVLSASFLGANLRTAAVNTMLMTIYYTTSGGFDTTPDAVVYASQSAEVRTEGVVREDSTGTAYGPASAVYGDLPRLPPSGLEGRAVEVFVKPSMGNLDDEIDAELDGFTVQVKHRPSYLFNP